MSGAGCEMIRTKDTPVEKTPGHILALETLLPHDMAASEVLALVLGKLKVGQEEVNELVLNRVGTVDVALVALPRLESLAREVIKASVVEFNNALPAEKRTTQDLDVLDFDVVSLLTRCEHFQKHSSLLREQIKEVAKAILPMSLSICTECTLPPTAEELAEMQAAREQEELLRAQQQQAGAKSKGKKPSKEKKSVAETGGKSSAREMINASRK